MVINKAKYLETVTVVDPDTGGDVHIDIFKDSQSNGIFGIDASYLEQVPEEGEAILMQSPFEDNTSLLLVDEYGENY